MVVIQKIITVNI
ncbi:hypothetical protein FWK35_00027186 [Aphis craccivora]|uniref:Uncharacterized protein n=1 Tax=Aphis craccivora TaxID=307492 RepID=A0A6G0Y9I2_APHCR|nr:hypothetical protein FWK35_00027186 [Aphis craccivora]